MTPRLACPSDCIFLRKFTLLLFTISWKCPLFRALFFTSFIQVHTSTIVSSKIMDESYIQSVYIFITFKGFLDMGRPPFFKFHEQMNIFYFHLPLCLNTYISIFMYEIYFHYSYHFCGCVVRPSRKLVCLVLSIGVNFLLHHRDRENWILLAIKYSSSMNDVLLG